MGWNVAMAQTEHEVLIDYDESNSSFCKRESDLEGAQDGAAPGAEEEPLALFRSGSALLAPVVCSFPK